MNQELEHDGERGSGIVSYSFSSAVRYLSKAPRPLTDGGSVDDATGWKVARLIDPHSVMFAGLAFGVFPAHSVAVCLSGDDHLAPTIGCECGFYAMKSKLDALALLDPWRALVLLRVELYGEMIEHRIGWRAAEQDIVAMHLPGGCAQPFCRRGTAGVGRSIFEGVFPGERLRFGAGDPNRGRWVPKCSAHLGENGVTLQQLRANSGMDVVLLESA